MEPGFRSHENQWAFEAAKRAHRAAATSTTAILAKGNAGLGVVMALSATSLAVSSGIAPDETEAERRLSAICSSVSLREEFIFPSLQQPAQSLPGPVQTHPYRAR